METTMKKEWTINDARKGDILSAQIDGHIAILIFKEFYGFIRYYILWTPSRTYINNEAIHDCFHPATQGEKDLLLQEMKKEGWEFDFENCKLKYIEE